MPNSIAEAYLLILRPSNVPVIGEAVPIPFNEQIEIDEWSWTLENDDFISRRAVLDQAQQLVDADDDTDDDDDDDDGTKAEAQKKKMATDLDTARGVASGLNAIHRQTGLSQDQRDDAIKKLMKQAKGLSGELEKTAKQAAANQVTAKKPGQPKPKKAKDSDGKLQFTFKKNVDAATTQLLNSMKGGDVMPRAILTLFHRSTNAPVTLAIKFERVLLKKYELSVEPSDTMSDLKEEWTANYESVEWTYQNRPPASGPNGVTQGTVRVFKKKNASII